MPTVSKGARFASLLAVLFVLEFLFSPKPVAAEDLPSLKKGVGGDYTKHLHSEIKVSWFYNWQHFLGVFGQEARFVPMIRVGRSESSDCSGPWRDPDFSHFTEEISELLRYHRGLYWLVGNEPEIGDQDNIQKECALKRYREAMAFVRERDQTAKFIVGGFHLNPTRPRVGEHAEALVPLKNEPGFAGWHVHLYLDSQKDLGASLTNFRQMLDGFASWVGQRGVGGELWITEFLESNWGGSREHNLNNITQLMRLIVPALETDPRVTRYAWFSLRDPQPGLNQRFTLFDNPGLIKGLGRQYASLGLGSHCPVLFSRELGDRKVGNLSAGLIFSSPAPVTLTQAAIKAKPKFVGVECCLRCSVEDAQGTILSPRSSQICFSDRWVDWRVVDFLPMDLNPNQNYKFECYPTGGRVLWLWDTTTSEGTYRLSGCSSSPLPLVGDLNNDQRVDEVDRDLLLSGYYAVGGVADLDGSGRVDAGDYLIFVSNFGRQR